MKTSIRLFAAIAAIATMVIALPALAQTPPDLVELERQVSLELAHVRDSGPTDPAKREQLYEASRSVQKGETEIKSSDYKDAEQSLLHARELLRKIRED
ncbi:MAG: hypothetical protein WBY93_07680 [Candidatus Binatus sp.]